MCRRPGREGPCDLAWQPAPIELELSIDQLALNLEMKVLPGGSREHRGIFGPVFSAPSGVLVSGFLLMEGLLNQLSHTEKEPASVLKESLDEEQSLMSLTACLNNTRGEGRYR